jgi:hypothetical protein
MHLFVIPGWFTGPFFVALALLAIWKGGWREAIVAVAQAVEMVVSTDICRVATCRIGPYALWATEALWRPALDDGFILAVCLACVVRAERYWTIWACSFALLGEISDLTIFASGVTRWAWLSASLVWSYAVAAAVLWGVLTHGSAGRVWRRSQAA